MSISMSDGMKKLVFCATFLTAALAFGGPFDWQHSYIGTPFAVFYNPALIGSGSMGYSLGFDTRYVDRANYDVRGALTLPIGKIEINDRFTPSIVYDYFDIANTPYNFLKKAISAGGTLSGEGDYRLSAGYSMPLFLHYLLAGASFDYTLFDERQALSISAASSVKVPYLVGRLLFTAHNFAATERTDGNPIGF